MHVIDIIIRLFSREKVEIPSDWVDLPDGVEFRINDFLTDLVDAYAVTFHKTIVVCKGSLPRSRVMHELEHVRQQDGRFFRFAWEYLFKGKKAHYEELGERIETEYESGPDPTIIV